MSTSVFSSRTLDPSPTYFLDLQGVIDVQTHSIAFVVLSGRQPTNWDTPSGGSPPIVLSHR
jgi:hypothetical protein